MSAARNQRIRAKKKIKALVAKLTPEEAEKLAKELKEKQND